jgi:hypothetical protein
MTRDEVRSIQYPGDITTSPTQQRPSDPRHIHRHNSATKKQFPSNLLNRMEISAGLEEQLHDRQMTSS